MAAWWSSNYSAVRRSDKWNCPSPKYAEYLTCKLILNFKSIGLNISPAIIHLKINAVRFGNALLQNRCAGDKDTEGRSPRMNKTSALQKDIYKILSQWSIYIILKDFRARLECICGGMNRMTLSESEYRALLGHFLGIWRHLPLDKNRVLWWILSNPCWKMQSD